MNMELKRICKWLVIIGTLTIWSVKFGIRPTCDCQEPLRFFLGIAPNLLGSFLIPFGAYWFFSGRSFLLARIFQIQSITDVRNVCMIGFGLLVMNEYLQLIPLFGRTFDYFDLLFSGLGLSLSYVVFGRIQSAYEPQGY
jgi:hypothetical protein